MTNWFGGRNFNRATTALVKGNDNEKEKQCNGNYPLCHPLVFPFAAPLSQAVI